MDRQLFEPAAELDGSLVGALVEQLRIERKRKTGGIYHKLQIDFAYNSNHIEGSRLTHEQTRYLFETQTIESDEALRADDVVEAVNHFACFNYMLDTLDKPLTEELIKEYHRLLKSSTTDSLNEWFVVGDYKRRANVVGDRETASPAEVPGAMRKLLKDYGEKARIGLEDIVDFHVRLEAIHPFQDGNGRVGRLVMFRECLVNRVMPFIITENLRYYYYRGLSKWEQERGWLADTCLAAQDNFRAIIDYFGIGEQNPPELEESQNAEFALDRRGDLALPPEGEIDDR